MGTGVQNAALLTKAEQERVQHAGGAESGCLGRAWVEKSADDSYQRIHTATWAEEREPLCGCHPW